MQNRRRGLAIGDRVASTLHSWHLSRYREVLGVMVRFGLSDFVENLGKGRLTALRVSPVALREALTELGPAFIKLGQILSTRDELLPAPFRIELAKLQDQVPSFSHELARSVIESELGADLHTIFRQFDPIPIASGSIGQVHRACLADGTEVVTKIQRPGVEEVLARDSAIIRHFSDAFGGQPQTGDRAARLVSEFLAATESELDYTREAEQLERFAWQFEHDPGICVPRLVRAYSTRRVLTMTYVPGSKLSDVDALPSSGAERRSAARLFATAVLKQIFSFGYFHGDPHPANVFVREGGFIGFYDLGLVGELSRTERECLSTMLLGLLEQQADVATDALLSLAETSRPVDRQALLDEVAVLMRKYFRQPSAETAVHRMLQDILAMTARCKLTLPPGFYLVFKVLATVESTGRRLDADFDLVSLALPVLRRTRPGGTAASLDTSKAIDIGVETLMQLRDLPVMVQGALRQLNDGQLRIQFDHKGLEQAIDQHRASNSRLGASIFASAVVLGGLGLIGFCVQARLLNLQQAALTAVIVVILAATLLRAVARPTRIGSRGRS